VSVRASVDTSVLKSFVVIWMSTSQEKPTTISVCGIFSCSNCGIVCLLINLALCRRFCTMSERVRVLRIIARLNIGGPAIHAALLTERLDPIRYDSRLVAGREGAQEGNYLALHGQHLTQLTVIPELGREIQGWADVKALAALIRLMQKFRPQVVHTHTAKAGTLGRLAAHFARVPVVVHTYHGHVFHGYFSPTKTKIFLAIERWLAWSTDRLLAVSNQVRRELLDLGIGSPERLTVLPLGLNLDRLLTCEDLRGGLRNELGVKQDVLLVGIIARLVAIKRHEWFLEAAAKVATAYPNCQFLLIGDGDRRQELEALVQQLSLASQVRFLGWRSDLVRIYADLDLVALTSANEGSPVSLIEAMAAGKAVVCTRVGGVPDIVADGIVGLLVAPGDTTALAEAITALLADPQRRRQMGEAGRQRMYPAFSAQRLVQDMDQLYTSLLLNKL
jgi:glycosyltransferase involved in cell wall biosynthesis